MLTKVTFSALVWEYPGQAAWHFISVPKSKSATIRRELGGLARGFGSLPVLAKVGRTEWRTSIFPDNKSGSYLLPIKARIRQQENIQAGSRVTCALDFSPAWR